MDFQSFLLYFTPGLLSIVSVLFWHIISGLDKRIEKVEEDMKSINIRLGGIEGKIGKLEGLLEGYFSRPASRD